MKKPILISAACVALSMLLLFLSFQSAPKREAATADVYGLVIQSDTGTFVMQLQKGMQQAANELGVRLSVCGPQELEQLAGAAGAALWLEEPGEAAEKLDDMGVPVAVVGKSLSNHLSVRGDDSSAGKQLISYGLKQSEPQRVLLLLDDEDVRATMRSRAAATIARERSALVMEYQPDMELPEACDVVVTTSTRATKDMAERKRNGSYTGLVLGVDTGDSRVPDLEDGLVSAMALDSPYAMGYLALYRVQTLATEGSADNALTDVLLATPQNMYLSENVKQVFPLLQ